MMVTKQDIENKKVAGLAKLDEIEATYENDTYTPTITVKNKSSVKTGEGDEVDYSANVMDGPAKSAILTGQTLVNIVRNGNSFLTLSPSPQMFTLNLSYNLEKNKKYLIVGETTQNEAAVQGVCLMIKRKALGTKYIAKLQMGVGIFSYIITPDDEITGLSFYIHSDDRDNGKTLTVGKAMVLEYQDGMENWNIPYFEGMQSVKMPDLMPSGTHPSTTPYCWKNGHIQLSSSGLLPNLEYSVVTSRAGQINQNATMIVKNDKRIFDLEILLAGGLVNTTYQALTLQNQVETGLSKVSLSSETEPDYLLYHMIMKLIEEKAYKLDDLTEKVSVFYLYEKLSDEQFETIYSALYPFVEDEIVEEPVVEELPEVVEDEVIM